LIASLFRNCSFESFELFSVANNTIPLYGVYKLARTYSLRRKKEKHLSKLLFERLYRTHRCNRRLYTDLPQEANSIGFFLCLSRIGTYSGCRKSETVPDIRQVTKRFAGVGGARGKNFSLKKIEHTSGESNCSRTTRHQVTACLYERRRETVVRNLNFGFGHKLWLAI
jgi:hypothetical protein